MSNLKQFLHRSSSVSNNIDDQFKSSSKKLKILIIQPPSSDAVASYIPHIQSNEDISSFGFKPPLGILYLATTLIRDTNHDVKVIDSQVLKYSYKDVVDFSLKYKPDLVAISAWTDWWFSAFTTGKQIKEALPKTKLCYGGPHVSIYPQETLDLPFVDMVIKGDGEIPLMYLSNLIANNKVSNLIPGLHFKEYGVKKVPDDIFVHPNLDELPIPDRTLLPIKKYSSVLAKNSYTTTMITSRGCPHRCTFCKLNFQKNIARSAESVIEEFKIIESLGINEVEIYDDTFTWSKERLVQICEGLIKNNNKIMWSVRDRVNKTNVDILKLMYKAGCRRIHYGIESGVQKVIDKMRKQIKIEDAITAVNNAKKVGMTVLTYFMFGNLDETYSDMQETAKFSKSLNSDYTEFSITIPYAGTEMYEEALKNRIIDNDYWFDFAVNPTPNFKPPQLIENKVTVKEMLELRDKAVKEYYFRPKYILKELTKTLSVSEFIKKARMGITLAQSVYRK